LRIDEPPALFIRDSMHVTSRHRNLVRLVIFLLRSQRDSLSLRAAKDVIVPEALQTAAYMASCTSHQKVSCGTVAPSYCAREEPLLNCRKVYYEAHVGNAGSGGHSNFQAEDHITLHLHP
jgi:hypothetical protein